MFEMSPELHRAVDALEKENFPSEATARKVVCNSLVSIAQSLETLADIEKNKAL